MTGHICRAKTSEDRVPTSQEPPSALEPDTLSHSLATLPEQGPRENIASATDRQILKNHELLVRLAGRLADAGERLLLKTARDAYESFEKNAQLPGRAPWETLPVLVRHAWLEVVRLAFDARVLSPCEIREACAAICDARRTYWSCDKNDLVATVLADVASQIRAGDPALDEVPSDTKSRVARLEAVALAARQMVLAERSKTSDLAALVEALGDLPEGLGSSPSHTSHEETENADEEDD